jgi:acyl carrier protein
MNNRQKLIDAFASALSINPELINNELTYQSIPEWDSISHMVLISQIEGDFNINLETNDVIEMSGFDKAVEILSKYNIEFK